MKKSLVRVVVAVVAVFALMAGSAAASHVFGDVDDARFYAVPAEWALANGITQGCQGGVNFCPEDPVTRGENITFAYRYDQNVVQPALAEIPTFHFASIGSAGNVMASSPGVTAQATAAVGNFRVIFPAGVNVTNCFATTTIGATQIGSGSTSGSIGVTQTGDLSNGVFVRTLDATGSAAYQPFTLQLACPAFGAAALVPASPFPGNGEPQE